MHNYREVICPWCKHRFMWYESPISKPWAEYIDVIDASKPVGYGAKCPKCDREMIVVKGRMEGLFLDEAEEIFLPGFKEL